VQLEDLLAEVDHVAFGGDETVDVTSVEYDSRRVGAGALFCCLVGSHIDGHLFADDAVERGAVALLAERRLPVDVPQAIVPNSRKAMAWAAATLYGNPSHALEVVGVTGTNGKTTVTHLLGNIWNEAGRQAGVLGTLSAERTTPEAPDAQRQLAAWRDEGVVSVAMEVSSHALALDRVEAMRFRVAVFTNLSRDHLDFHGSMESYFETKARLFEPAMSDAAVVNVDSPHGRLLLDAAKVPTIGYSLRDVNHLQLTATGSRFVWRDQPVELPLAGSFNVANALAAAEVGLLLGVAPDVVARGLSRPLVVPGRFEVIDEGQPFTVVVDYAHTPDGLEQLLTAARELAGAAQTLVVFGCGGDRDASKRAPMGEVAARLADRVVITADNSRGETTGAIIDTIRGGFDRARTRGAAEPLVEPDRRRAIAAALAAAGAGDVVLIAGKGHESTLTIDDTVVPFDDREVVREELRRIGGGCP
jgi:UDP-N-acetylmuramoyl-L-alanyl-D-glutamate--2,6-diaminopimelate ligase